MRRGLLIALGIALLLPAGAAAQRRPRGPRRAAPRTAVRQSGAQGFGVAFNPQMLLRRQGALDLSDEQVTQLETLANSLRTAMEEGRDATREHGEALRDAWRADDLDPEAITTHARAMLGARQEVELAGIEASARAMVVLSPEQRGRVHGWRDGRDAVRGRDRLDNRRSRSRMRRARRFE